MSQMEFPKYIKVQPEKTDSLLNNPHDKVADVLLKLITENRLPNNVIGLEGSWGSGKSSVIKMLEEKFDKSDKNYVFFTYDAWSHQEDLTRKTFLEELIRFLRKNNHLDEDTDWDKKLNVLLSNSTKTHLEKYPKVQWYWVLITLAILSFAIGSEVFDTFSGTNIFPKIEVPFLKEIIIKYLSPIVFIIFGILAFKNEYDAHPNSDEKTGKKYNWKEKISRLFYVFSGNEIESEELEYTIENEPSVFEFKHYLNSIVDDLNKDGLVIVFDNMDRLSSSEKLKSLWSAIHTFFAEMNIEKTVVILPYDRTHLEYYFDDVNDEKDNREMVKGYIKKTISSIFMVPPPVLSSWKEFLNSKLDLAFGELIKDKPSIVSIFEKSHFGKPKNPRDLISFVNDLVSLYFQYGDKLDMKVLALYSLKKYEIAKNPQAKISTLDFVSWERHLFEDLSSLRTALASLVFNVEKKHADEVLLSQQIRDSLLKGDFTLLEQILKHNSFKYYLNSELRKLDLSEVGYEKFVPMLKELNLFIDKSIYLSFWKELASRILSEESITNNGKLNDWLKTLIEELKGSKQSKNQILQKAEKENRDFFNTSNGEEADWFTSNLTNIIETAKDNNIKLNVGDTKFNPENFNDFISNLVINSEDYLKFKDYNVKCENKELNDYYLSTENHLEMVSFNLDNIDFLLNNSDYDFSNVIEEINSQATRTTIQHNQLDKIWDFIEICLKLNKDKTIGRFEFTKANQILHNIPSSEHKIYPYVVSNLIAEMLDNGQNPQSNIAVQRKLMDCLSKEDDCEKIANVMPHYLSYEMLLKLPIKTSKKHILIKAVVNHITDNNEKFDTTLKDIKWVFNNLSILKKEIFANDLSHLLEVFDEHEDEFEDCFDKDNVFELESSILDFILEDDIKDTKTISHLRKKCIESFEQADSSTWTSELNSDSNFDNFFKKFWHKNILPKKILTSSDFKTAVKNYFIQIAKGEESVPSDDNLKFWTEAQDKNKLGSLISIFDAILENLMENLEVPNDTLDFFYKGIFINCSDRKLKDKSDNIVSKLLLKEDTDYLLETYQNFPEKLKLIVEASNYKDDINSYIQSVYLKVATDRKEIISDIANSLGFAIKEPKKENIDKPNENDEDEAKQD